jgi:DNA-binding transcriptional ArsR family regulator
MTISLAVIDALVEAGCTAAQLAAAIRADVEDRARRRAARAALRSATVPAANMNEPATESASPAPIMNEADSVAAPSAVAAGGVDRRKAEARRALLMANGLRPAARLVGAALVECFNLGTGRCDPALGYLSDNTGLSVRSVRRAIGQLIDAGLVSRAVHGGWRHANAYQPDWVRLTALASETGNVRKMNEADSVPTRTLVAADPDRRVRQNHIRKQDSESEAGSRARAMRHAARRPDPRQPQMLLPIVSNRAKETFGAASTRLWADIRKAFGGKGKVAFVEASMRIVDTEGLYDAAVEAEQRRWGDGIGVVLKRLDDPATGPPLAVTG